MVIYLFISFHCVNSCAYIHFLAKVLMHMVNHMGHYPLGAGPSRVDSLISEHEDNPNVDAEELSPSIFSAPNVQVGSEAYHPLLGGLCFSIAL